MQQLFDGIMAQVGPFLPRLAGALLILLVGWLVALILAAAVRGVMRRTRLDDRIATWLAGDKKPDAPKAETLASKGVFYVVMLFALIAFFQALGLTIVTQPLNGLLTTVFEFAPRILGAAALVLVAWGVATVVRLVVTRVVGASGLEEKLGASADRQVSLGKTIGDALYWLIWLVFLPGILGALGLGGMLEPVQQMMNEVLGILPNLLAGAATFLIGWFVARIVRQIVTSLLAVTGLDALGERIGLGSVFGKAGLSGAVGLVVYVLILIPVLVGALNTIGFEAITAPASNMLNTILAAVPSVFAALLILFLAYVLGRLLASLVSNLLAAVGFDNIFVKLGLSREPAEGASQPSRIAGSLVLAGVIAFAISEAGTRLGLAAVPELVAQFLVFAGHLVVGLVIMLAGLYLANLAGGAVRAATGQYAGPLSTLTRVAVLGLTGAMALRQMGLANEIISLAFGLVLGAVAVAVAIAFGIGGREVASKQLALWMAKADSD